MLYGDTPHREEPKREVHAAVHEPHGDGEAVDNGCSFEDWIRYDREMKDAGIWVSGHPCRT